MHRRGRGVRPGSARSRVQRFLAQREAVRRARTCHTAYMRAGPQGLTCITTSFLKQQQIIDLTYHSA